MKPLLVAALLVTIGTSVASSAAEAPPASRQIAIAVQAAPEKERDACTVLGYDDTGKLVTLREGTNNLICLADDPKLPGISVACYEKGLEPFMRRGRDLRAEGKDDRTVFATREAEVKAGTLKIPDKSILFVVTGTGVSPTGEIENRYLRYVIYIPYATPESTGIPKSPAGPGGPWLMDAGTHHAHIMINPPRG
ncbi:MAG TPA: hypothetical protein VG710_05850 [Opitutus sp.]|nr:hypothetical protein [Opitutus sp.]